MKVILTFINVFFLIASCNGQNTIKSNEFVNSTDLKGKIWHTSIHRYGGTIVKEFHPSGNGFSNQIFLYFLDKDSVQLKHYEYSPSIGGRTKTIYGTYHVDNKNEVSIVFIEPEDLFGRSVISINGKDVQYTLYSLSVFRNIDVSLPDITELPQIKTYRFKIIEQLIDDNIIAELTLFDKQGAKYRFGNYKFASTTEITSQ